MGLVFKWRAVGERSRLSASLLAPAHTDPAWSHSVKPRSWITAKLLCCRVFNMAGSRKRKNLNELLAVGSQKKRCGNFFQLDQQWADSVWPNVLIIVMIAAFKLRLQLASESVRQNGTSSDSKFHRWRNDLSRCVEMSHFCFFVCDSLCPVELPAASCLRTSLPGSITVKQMPGQCLPLLNTRDVKPSMCEYGKAKKGKSCVVQNGEGCSVTLSQCCQLMQYWCFNASDRFKQPHCCLRFAFFSPWQTALEFSSLLYFYPLDFGSIFPVLFFNPFRSSPTKAIFWSFSFLCYLLSRVEFSFMFISKSTVDMSLSWHLELEVHWASQSILWAVRTPYGYIDWSQFNCSFGTRGKDVWILNLTG